MSLFSFILMAVCMALGFFFGELIGEAGTGALLGFILAVALIVLFRPGEVR
jgi:hypothetical protein